MTPPNTARPTLVQNESFKVTAGPGLFAQAPPLLRPNPPGGVPTIDPLPKFVPAEKNIPFPRLVVLNMVPAAPCPKLLPAPLPPGPILSRNDNLKLPIEELMGRETLARIIWLKLGGAPAPKLPPR